MFETTTSTESVSLIDLPAMGQPLANGIFAGLTTVKDGKHCAIVLLADKPANDLTWKAAMAWAHELNAMLPTRPIAALLHANVRDQLGSTWHWTSEEFDGSYAWCQSYYGDQYGYLKGAEGRARAVRLIHLTT